MSLFDIEIKSHWLKEQLGKPHSTRLRLLYLSDFLTELIKFENTNKYISYYNEFVPELIKLILKNEFQYFSPNEIDNLLLIVNAHQQLSFSKEDSEKCGNVLQNARRGILSVLTGNNNKPVKSYSDSINVVLIETNSDRYKSVGTVQTLILRSSIRGNEFPEDKIEFENLCDSDDEKLQMYIANVVAFSKEQANDVISKSGAYNLTFSFGNKDCSYTGSSFGLALLALTYNSILVNELHRIHYKFYDDVDITGAIDESGNLIKLDCSTLKTKIETVFFSGFTKFVIPEDNIVEAKEILSELQKEYPQRKLELIPCANFKSLFQNLAVVEVHKLKLKEKFKANYRRYHSIVNITLSIIILFTIMVVVTQYLVPVLDRHPVYVGLQSGRYVTYNKYGKSVWESQMLSDQDINMYNNTEREKRIILYDLDNDGYNDILLLLSDEKNKILNRTLFCYNYDGYLKWKTVIPQHDSLYGNEYCGNDILILSMSLINSANKKEIAITFRTGPMFPNFTAKLNSQGKIISEFYNPGTINKIVNYDFDGDTNEELFCSGINNDYDRSGVLILFDPEYLDGCAPGYRFPKNRSIGLMKYYLLFPKTDVGRFTNYGSSFARLVDINNEKIIVIIREYDSYTDIKNIRHFQEYTTLYTLDKKLNVLHVETSSEFDTKYQMLVKEGKLKPITDWKKFKNKLISNVRWWDGDKFVNYPTMNKYYLQAKAEQAAKNLKKLDKSE